MKGKIYLVPTTMGESNWEEVIPKHVKEVATSCQYFIVENIRTARRFLRKLDAQFDIDGSTFYEINKRTKPQELHRFIKPALKGNSIAVMSEAGCPGVADPGADIARIAHQNDLQVVPLVGPSSILMSLMASGLNGQHFTFHGYLPIKKGDRIAKIKALEAQSMKDHSTQMFIEAPYRNNPLLEDLIYACSPSTKLCIAKNITLEDEMIQTKSVSEWKKQKPDLHKQTCMFLFNAH